MKLFGECLLLAFFLSPLAVLVAHIDGLVPPPIYDVLPFLMSAFWQATLSALFSLLGGTLLCLGLISIPSARVRHAFEIFFLIPGFVPSIFIVLSVLQIYSFFGVHPMGYLGVVSANVIMSAGLVGVFLMRAFLQKVGGFAELAYIEGAAPSRTLLTLAPLLWRDFAALFVAVFIFAFLGFSIPLVLGGLQAATLEVQIYRKVMAEGALGQALTLSLLQFVFIAVCTQLVPFRYASQRAKATYQQVFFLGSPLLLLLAFIGNCFILMAPMGQFLTGASAVFRNEFLSHLILSGSLGTLLVSIAAGILTLVLAAIVLYGWPSIFINRFFFAYSAPSAVLVGFGFYLMGYHISGFALQILFLGVILGLFFWSSLYRIAFFGVADNLRGQIEIARQMGADSKLIFTTVTWPQARTTICAMSALAALWAAGDFGISSMLAVGDSTLALLVKGLISRYLLAEATFVLWILILVAVMAALLFLGLNHVTDRKHKLSV